MKSEFLLRSHTHVNSRGRKKLSHNRMYFREDLSYVLSEFKMLKSPRASLNSMRVEDINPH